MLEGVSSSFIALVLGAVGMPGMAVVFWYVDQRRADKKDAVHQKELAALLAQIEEERKQQGKEMREILDAYREDIRRVSRFYEDNVTLVRGYDKYCNDMVDTVRLNTSAMQSLTDFLKNKVPCYQIKKEIGG